MDGEGPAPFTLFLSRLCEEFHCPPSVAYREWLQAPMGLLEEILEARAFAATKAAIDRSPEPEKLPQTAMLQLTKDVIEAVALEDTDAAADDD